MCGVSLYTTNALFKYCKTCKDAHKYKACERCEETKILRAYKYCNDCSNIVKKENKKQDNNKYYLKNKGDLSVINKKNNIKKNIKILYVNINKYGIKKIKKKYLTKKKEKRKNNPEFIKKENERRKKYRAENKDKIKISKNKYEKDRKKRDPVFKLRRRVSCAIYLALKHYGSSKKSKSVWKYLPYSAKELKIYLEDLFEPWMTWNNHGNYNENTWNDNEPNTWTWQIDHIIPHSNLRYASMEDENFKKCWGLENLRPYSAKQNILDGTRRTRHKKDNK